MIKWQKHNSIHFTALSMLNNNILHYHEGGFVAQSAFLLTLTFNERNTFISKRTFKREVTLISCGYF